MGEDDENSGAEIGEPYLKDEELGGGPFGGIDLGKIGEWNEAMSGFLLCSQVRADVDDVIGDDAESDPALHAIRSFVARSF